jgi:hypothetical protein
MPLCVWIREHERKRDEDHGNEEREGDHSGCRPNRERRSGHLRVADGQGPRRAAIYVAKHSDRQIRQAIQAEARRCGYTPGTILAIHYEA